MSIDWKRLAGNEDWQEFWESDQVLALVQESLRVTSSIGNDPEKHGYACGYLDAIHKLSNLPIRELNRAAPGEPHPVETKKTWLARLRDRILPASAWLSGTNKPRHPLHQAGTAQGGLQ